MYVFHCLAKSLHMHQHDIIIPKITVISVCDHNCMLKELVGSSQIPSQGRIFSTVWHKVSNLLYVHQYA